VATATPLPPSDVCGPGNICRTSEKKHSWGLGFKKFELKTFPREIKVKKTFSVPFSGFIYLYIYIYI
jgi:hypothetical protein